MQLFSYLDVDSSILELLINGGVNPSILDNDEDSALNVAVKSGSAAFLTNKIRRPSLTIDFIVGNEAAVDLLLRHGENVNRIMKHGMSPMHYAAANGIY